MGEYLMDYDENQAAMYHMQQQQMLLHQQQLFQYQQAARANYYGVPQ